MNKTLPLILACITILFSANTYAETAEDSRKAVILAYSYIDQAGYDDQNISDEQFSLQIKELQKNSYNKLPLEQALRALENKETLPPRSLSITFDGAYKSTLFTIAPTLLKAKIPFTIFYDHALIDNKHPAHGSWKDLKKLNKNKLVTLGVRPESLSGLAHLSHTDTLTALNRARQRHREELSEEANYIAYPLGEYTAKLQKLTHSQGFKAALTLNRGAAHSGADPYAIPRFAINENTAPLERFRTVLNALPLPIKDIEPQQTLLNNEKFHVGFTLPDELANTSNSLACVIDSAEKPIIERLGSRIEIRSAEDLSATRRIHLTCTLPKTETTAESDSPQYRWLGLIFHRPEKPL